MKNSRKGGRIMETKDEKVLKEPFAEIGRKMHLLLHTGQLLMENGADSDRTVRDMMRTAAYMGIPKDRIHQHVMYTTLMLNVNDEQHSYTEFRKCTKHGINMTTLTAISKLTWRALEKNYSLHEFERHLLRIKNRPRNYPVWLTALGAGAACGGFCKLFGGDWTAVGIVFTATLVGFAVKQRMQAHAVNHFLVFACSAFVASLCATAALRFDCTAEIALATSPLFLVPGVPLINGVIDIMEGHVRMGGSRLVNALLQIVCIAVGLSATLLMVKDSLL